jgi:hypothetical protein
MTHDPPVASVIAAARAPARRRSTTLKAWLSAHRDELREPLSGKPNWTAFAAALADAGLTGRRGTVLSGDIVRKAWRRIKAEQNFEG